MFIQDLAPFPDFPASMPMRSIGWLSGEYVRGQVPENFVDKLGQVEKDETLVFAIGTAGFHICEYCHPDGRTKECCDELAHTSCATFTSTSRNGFVWPEMLTHYVRDHGYKPPDEFVEWVIKQQ